jgi:hypothetical protein
MCIVGSLFSCFHFQVALGHGASMLSCGRSFTNHCLRKELTVDITSCDESKFFFGGIAYGHGAVLFLFPISNYLALEIRIMIFLAPA